MTNSAPLTRNSRLTSYLRAALKPRFAFSAGIPCTGKRQPVSKRGHGLVGAAVAASGLLLGFGPAQADDIFLWGNPGVDTFWDNAANWTLVVDDPAVAGAPPPNIAGESARFTTSAFTNPTLVMDITVDSVYYLGPTAFTIQDGANAFNIIGGGFLNSSGLIQTVNNNAGGTITIGNLATAGTNMVFNNQSAFATIQFTGGANGGAATINNTDTFAQVLFFDQSTGANATVNNTGLFSSVSAFNSSTLGNATIFNVGTNSAVVLSDQASGGTARIVNIGANSLFDITTITTAGTIVGSIEGVGTVDLGNKNLIVGGPGRSTVFSGVIQGIGGSLSISSGTLRLNGVNTYTGNTVVQGGGNLFVNGSIASPNTYVNRGGLLGGTGTIFGNVFSHGIVKPGNSPGTLTVRGNYTQYSDGELRIEIASKNNYGRLRVGGVANLDGTVSAVAVNGFKPKRGDSFEILTAGGGVNGRFDTVRDNFGRNTILFLEAIYKSNSVILKYQQGSFLDFARWQGLTYNQRSVARALDKVVFDNRERRMIDYLNERQLSELPTDFDRIAPEELTAAAEIAISYANVSAANVLRHNDDIRSGTAGITASGLSAQGNTIGYSGPIAFRTGAAGPSGKETKEIKDVVPEENRWGAFLTGVGEWVDVESNGNARGYDINTGGFTVGLDYKITPNFALGISAGYVGSAADLTNNGRIFVNGGKLGLYSTYFTGGFYLDTAVTGGYNSYSTRRGGLGGTVRGDTDGGELSALLATGYDIKTGGWSFGPTANIQYTYVGIDGFQERGSLAPLNVQDQEQESLRTAIGFRASYDIKLRGGAIVIRPEVRTAWQHEFADDTFAIDARFRSNAGNTFSVDAPDTGRDSFLLGAGVVVLFGDRFATYLYYDGQLARANYESHGLSGGVRISF